MSEEESFKLTTSQHKFVREAESFLRKFLESGKEKGLVSQDAELQLYVETEDTDEESMGGVGLYLGVPSKGKRKPIYVVRIPTTSLGDWDTIRHEAGHVTLGNPESGTPTSVLKERYDLGSIY